MNNAGRLLKYLRGKSKFFQLCGRHVGEGNRLDFRGEPVIGWKQPRGAGTPVVKVYADEVE
jgi:hypothetical protein